MRGMGSSEHLLYAHSRLPHTGREHRGTLLGLEVSTELVGSKRSEQWGQLSAALSLNNVRLKSTADWTYVRCGGEAVTTAWLGSWEGSVSVLRNLSPMQDGPRDCWIDGDPKRLRICFHSECSPSALLEREPTEPEKTLSTDRWDRERKKCVYVCACVCVYVYLCRQCVSIDPQSSSTFWKKICQMGIRTFTHTSQKKKEALIHYWRYSVSTILSRK